MSGPLTVARSQAPGAPISRFVFNPQKGRMLAWHSAAALSRELAASVTVGRRISQPTIAMQMKNRKG
jgi:hypothetical protein